MRIILLVACLCFFLSSCKKEISTGDIIQSVVVDPTEANADGATVVTVTVILKDDIDQRSVSFAADNGSFVGSTKGDSLLVTAEKINGQLTAVAHLTMPNSPGVITVVIQPNIPDQKGRYVYTKTINTVDSKPAKIELASSAFNVNNNFEGEVILTGQLFNDKNKGVSKNKVVVMNDYDSTFKRINGAFRNESLTTKSDSKISAIYSPGILDAYQNIYVVATVLDETGAKSPIADTVKLFVTKK